jgi:hypothetical protein
MDDLGDRFTNPPPVQHHHPQTYPYESHLFPVPREQLPDKRGGLNELDSFLKK